MELIGELKEKLDKAESNAEKKEILEASGIALTNDELDKVAGGVGDDVEPGDVLPIDILYRW